MVRLQQWPGSEKATYRCDYLIRRTKVRAMARRLQNHEFAVRDLPVHVLSYRNGGDNVFTALQNQGRYRDFREVGPIVGVESDARELLCDVGIGPAEAVGEVLAKLRPVRI